MSLDPQALLAILAMMGATYFTRVVGFLLPARLDVLEPRRVRLTLHEGRYHQVRRMFAAAGNHVVALHRERIGGLDLDGLPLGAWRRLDDDARARLFVA